MEHNAKFHEFCKDGVGTSGVGFNIQACPEFLPPLQFNPITQKVQKFFKICAMFGVSIKVRFLCLIGSYLKLACFKVSMR